MNSSVVPGWSARPCRARGSRPRSRARDGTMSPAASLCVAPTSRRSRCRPRRGFARAAAPSRRAPRASPRPASRRSPIATRRIVEWPTRKPAFRRERAVDAVEVLAEGRQSHGTPSASDVERHALDAGQHAHQVVAVLGSERRDREPAVAADHGGHAVQRRRRAASCPRTPARRSACGCRRSRARRPCPSASMVRVACLVDVADRDDPAVADADVGTAPGRPVPSTTSPPRMTQSSMRGRYA